MSTAAALWWAVVASGIYHGVNPGMGWPLAVSAALMDRGQGRLLKALVALAVGHLAAMAAILFPFSALMVLAEWQREIQIGASLLVVALGICRTVETDAGHAAADSLMRGDAAIAAAVAAAHTLAMSLSGGALAAGVYAWLGLKFLSRSWFNLDVVWALSLVLVGALSLWAVL
jgi:hypothetical protein